VSFQAATYDPDTAYRWLPSAAMDKDHNIAVGYSKSSLSIKPGIFITGRLSGDPINTMGAEDVIQAGGGVQLSVAPNAAGNRWGDYSSMTLDPIDQCTFWYTNEYLKTDGDFNWSTRIASYKFPSCTPASAWGTLVGNVKSLTGAPLSGVVVTLSNGFAGSTDAAGNYSILVPAGTYNATAADAARNCATSSPAIVSVILSSGVPTSQDFVMTGTSNLQLNGPTVDDSTTGNNNGIVNLNECIRLTVPLRNDGCGDGANVSATLTTSTPGVTITQNTSTYPDLAIDQSRVNATAYGFQTNGTFVCGTTIAFTLNVTFTGGTKTLNFNVPTCAGGPNQTIPSSTLTTADLTQTDRLGRDGQPSSCSGKASPGGGFAGTMKYKTFTFTNTSGSAACYTVTINTALNSPATTTDIESAAYLTAYNPANLDLNYLGDSGVTGLGNTVGSATYSFTVPALSTFVVVVNTTSTFPAGQTSTAAFSGTVSGFPNTASGPGTCVANPSGVQALTAKAWSDTAVSPAPATSGKNKLEWITAPNGVVEIRSSTSGFPGTSVLGTVTADASGYGTVTYTGLNLGTTYYYTVFAKVGATYSAGRNVSARPQDATGVVSWTYNTGASALTAPGWQSAVYTVSNDRFFHGTATNDIGGDWPRTMAPATPWIPFAMNAPSQGRPTVYDVSANPILGTNSVAFLGSQDGYVYAVDGATGRLLWNSNFRLGEMIQAAPLVAFKQFTGLTRDLVIVGTRNSSSKNVLYALDAANGAKVWEFDNGFAASPSNAMGIINGAVLIDTANRRVYFASRAAAGGTTQTLFCLNFTDTSATKLWSAAIGDVDGTVSKRNSTIYVGNNTGVVYAFGLTSSTPLWSFATADGAVKAGVVTDRNSTRLFLSTTTKVWGLQDNGANATSLWQFTKPSWSPSGPLFDLTSGKLMFGANDGALHILTNVNTATPTETLRTVAGSSSVVGAALYHSGEQRAYVGNDGGALFAVKP
jgi:outer membrane protein assembly factor BamB